MGGFIVASSPSPEASGNNDNDFDNDDDGKDGGASSPSDYKMFTWYIYPLSLVTKRGSSFEMRVIILIGGGLV